MYFTSLLLALAAVPAMAVPWQHVGKRTSGFAASDATLYAYGNNISGLPLLLGATDGFVYLAESNTTSTNLRSVTWDIPALSDCDVDSAAATFANGTSPGYMWLDVSGGAFDNVQVLKNDTDAGTTIGITVFGKQVVYYNGSSLQSEFWAKQDVVSGSWTLHWNSDNEAQEGTTPVTIKTVAPAILTS